MTQGNIDNLHFGVILDDADFKKKIEEDIKFARKYNATLSDALAIRRKHSSSGHESARYLNTTKQITAQYAAQSRLLRELGVLAGSYFGIRGAAAFVLNMVRVTGQMETQRIALRTMLGDIEKADAVLGGVRDMALKSPYTFSDLGKYAKQLAAFGSGPDSIVHELQMMADLAAGVGVDMGRIILAWGQIRSATVLRGQELRQLTESGLPIMEELAKVLSEVEGRAVGVGEVFDLVGKRAVSFDMVRQAFENMTSEGGRFYDMQARLSESVEGKLSNLKDAYEDMLRTIGEANSDKIKGGIDFARRLMENYQDIGKVLAGLVVTFGSYKAALLAVSAAHKVAGFVENIRLVSMMRKEVGLLTAAQQAFNVASKANIYIALASAVLGVVAAVTTFNRKQEEATRNAGKAAQSYEEERRELRRLIDAAGDETKSRDERRRAVDHLNQSYGEYLDGVVKETSSAQELARAYDSVTDSLRRKYLEEQRAAMTGAEQEKYNSAQAGFWGYIQKMLPRTGASAKARGAIVAQLQNAFGLDGSNWGAAEIYREILAAIAANGGAVSDRVKGNLYSKVWDFTQARAGLAGAERQFKQFTDGFTSAIESAAAGADAAADQMLTKTQVIADGIRETSRQIAVLQQKAKSGGLTAAEVKTLADLREDLNDQQTAYKSLTGEEYGGKAARAYAQRNEDFYRQMERDVQKYADEITQAEIDALEDGNEKTLAALDFQHRKRVRALQEAYEDELRQLERADAQNGIKFNPETDPRAKAVLQKYSQAFLAESLSHETAVANADKAILEEREKNRLEYLRQFGTMQEKEGAIMAKYSKQIDTATRNQDGYLVKLLEGQRDNELDELRREYSALYAVIFSDAATLGGNLLARAITETQAAIDKAAADGDIKALAELYERLRGLVSERTGRSSWGIGGIREALRMIRTADVMMNSADRTTAENAIAEKAAGVELLEKSGRELLDIFRAAGAALESWDGWLGEIGKALSGIAGDADNLLTALTSTNRGDIMSAGIGSALNILQMVGDQISDNRQALAEWEAALRKADQAARLRAVEGPETNEDIFGVGGPFAKAIAGMQKYNRAMTELAKMEDSLAAFRVQTGTRNALNWGNIGKGAGSGAAAGAALGSIIPGLGTLIGAGIGAAVGAIAGGFSTQVKPVFDSLLNHYGELVDEDFNLNPKILDDYELLDDTTKEIVDNWKEIREAALSAQQEMRDNLSGIVGGMADEIRDKLAAAWRDRKIFSAIDEVGDYVSGMIEDVLEQSVFSSVFQGLFHDLQQSMENSFAPGGDQNITDDMAAFLEAWPGLLQAYSDAMEQARAAAAAQGLELWEPQTNSGDTLSSGISRELVEGNSSLIASYMNAVRGDVSAMRLMQSPFFTHTVPTLDNYMTQMLARMENINNSAQVALREMEATRNDVHRIASSVTVSSNGGNAIRTAK